jgi:two-component system, OmpR family, sensor histidine kinase KdpD
MAGGCKNSLSPRLLRIAISLAGLAALTYASRIFLPVNATTVGFAYLLLILTVASTWGFIEASILSVAAALAYNFFFLPPVGYFIIADPQNWMALITFLTTSLIASRLSTAAKRRALDAIERQQDIERLYAFSRAILLVEGAEPFPLELMRRLADIFELDLAVLYDRRTGEFYRAGPSELKGLEEPLRGIVLTGSASFNDPTCTLTAVRLGSQPIAGLAIKGARISDAVLQGVANLTAIGLERARAQDLAHEIEAAKRSEKLRTTLIDAMAHEFKTPLTSIRATTTLLRDSPDQPKGSWMEMIKIADEEAQRLENLIDDTIAMARLDSGLIKVNPVLTDVIEIVEEVLYLLRSEIQGRSLEVVRDEGAVICALDRSLIKLALKQLVDNALKYSIQGSPVQIRVRRSDDVILLEVVDRGMGIPIQEQKRIFERFYRGAAVQNRIPGSGLGLSIAHSIMQAHGGDLAVASHPGETVFCLILPAAIEGEKLERGTNSGR